MDAGLAALEERREEINNLNVFPVADGDTGDNMALTVRAVTEELGRLDGQLEDGELDDIGRTEIVEAVARAALLGARGNSGVILSQLIRGAAEILISTPGKPIDPALVTAAMLRASERARDSVRDPQEGTILTVIGDMARGLSESNGGNGDGDLQPGVDPATQDAVLARSLATAVAAGEESVARGPELLEILRESGVVDAGGYGLVVMFAGVVAFLTGKDDMGLAHQEAPAVVPVSDRHRSDSFRYCVNFAVSGADLDGQAHVPALEAIGDSVLVVGDRSTIRVHVHTDEPDAATALFKGLGEVSLFEVADMVAQVRQRERRLAGIEPARSLVLAVVAGEGLPELFESEGAWTLVCERTLNPSTRELIEAIDQAPADELVLLTGSSNVVMAAQEAARESDKTVEVVPTGSLQEGLFILAAHERDRDAAANARALTDALAAVRAGGVAPAANDDPGGRFRVGEAIGYVDGDLVAWGESSAVLEAVMGAFADCEALVAIHDSAGPYTRQSIEQAGSGCESLDVHSGSQPGWWLLLAAE